MPLEKESAQFHKSGTFADGMIYIFSYSLLFDPCAYISKNISQIRKARYNILFTNMAATAMMWHLEMSCLWNWILHYHTKYINKMKQVITAEENSILFLDHKGINDILTWESDISPVYIAIIDCRNHIQTGEQEYQGGGTLSNTQKNLLCQPQAFPWSRYILELFPL